MRTQKAIGHSTAAILTMSTKHGLPGLGLTVTMMILYCTTPTQVLLESFTKMRLCRDKYVFQQFIFFSCAYIVEMEIMLTIVILFAL